MTISQSISIKASAAQIYKALTSAEQFAEFTGAPAEISEDEGGAFSCFDGQIVGRHIELVTDSVIVQAWRASSMWPENVYSMVRFNIDEAGDLTIVELTHTGYPEDAAEHLEPGWHKMYWEPLKAYLE
jgi:activator of HSP90 ATPase